jgi:hypothetical protein
VNSESRTTAKPVFIILFFTCLVGLSVREAIAQQAPEDGLVTQTRPRRVEALPVAESSSDFSPAVSAGTIVIAYAAYAEAFNLEPVAAGRTFSSPSASPARTMTPALSARNWSPFPVPAPAASTAPMTVGEKFNTWFRGSFLSPGAYFGAIAKGMWGEIRDNDDFKKDTFKNFVADSGTRAARSFASSTTYGFYEKAVLPSIFKQDPRYHRSTKKGAGGKLLYAVSRIVVTQGDTCGCDQFNASFLLGGALGAVTANVWERSERTGPIHTTQRWMWHILFKAFGNVAREFLGGQ